MLKDLFFMIWYDTYGSGWTCLVVSLFFILLAVIIFVFARTKAQNKKFSKKHIISFIISLVFMWQIVPVCLDYIAHKEFAKKNYDKAIAIEKLAIKTSMIPWQKGIYYNKMAQLNPKDGKFVKDAYKKAFKYIKTYKYYWCWDFYSDITLYELGEYDSAIELEKCRRYYLKDGSIDKSIPNQLIARFYIMKKDYTNALSYINKTIEYRPKEVFWDYAFKSFILKELGQKRESDLYCQKAINLANPENKEKVKNVCSDYYNTESKRLKKIRQDLGIEGEL